jgi:integrase/recombinase XerD
MSRLDEFRAHVKALRGAETVAAYGRAAARFERYLAGRGLDIRAAPETALQDFVVALRQEGLTPATVRLWSIGARRYTDWLRERLPSVPKFKQPETPRDALRAPECLSERALLHYGQIARAVPEPYATALLLLPLTGLRVAELCKLRLGDLEMNVGPAHWVVLRVDGKGAKERRVPLLETGYPILRAYLTGWRSAYGADREQPLGARWLFPAPGGQPVSRRTIQAWARRIRAQLGAPRLTPHTLRRTYATMMAKRGVSPFIVAQLLGHANLDTTRRHYVRTELEQLLEGVKGVDVRV